MEITPGPLLRSRPAAVGLAGQDGLVLTRQDGTKKPVPSTADVKWLEQAGVQGGEPFMLTASFAVPRTSVYQFQTRLQRPSRDPSRRTSDPERGRRERFSTS